MEALGLRPVNLFEQASAKAYRLLTDAMSKTARVALGPDMPAFFTDDDALAGAERAIADLTLAYAKAA